MRNGLLEIGRDIVICVLTGIEVRNIMLKNPESTTEVGYGVDAQMIIMRTTEYQLPSCV